MSKLLYIQGSPREDRSHSRAVADAFVEAYRGANPKDDIMVLDIFKMDLPAFDGLAIQAKYAILNGKEHSEEELMAWKPIEEVINQFKSADKYVIAVPMWNFGIPYRLKQYIDVILQPGHTFSFTPEEGYKGLVTGKPVLTIYARGGEFAEGSDFAPYDLQKRYMEIVLGFIGFTDSRSIVVEPTLMGGPDVLAGKLNYAFEQGADSDFVFTYSDGTVSYANQPGLSNAHVFNHVGHPWLSQYWVRRVSRQAYGGTNPNIGYGGHDEDQGQMGGVSALMKLGLFSLRGTSSMEPVYEITAPEFDEVTIQLDPRYYSGREFRIIAHNNAAENMYIQKAELNGKALENCWFYHKDFARGGLLELWLGPEPNKEWGVTDE